jgi:hypothetical protein
VVLLQVAVLLLAIKEQHMLSGKRIVPLQVWQDAGLFIILLGMVVTSTYFQC